MVLLITIPVSAKETSIQKSDTEKVLILFSSQPGNSERAFVRKMGGEIKYTYHLVPAIAANVPSQALKGINRNPNVVAVEPDIEVQAVDLELDNTWGVSRIGVNPLHDRGNKGSGIKVAVLDTGIDLNHPDLKYDPACSMSFVDGETLDDGNSHGTHVAGTIAALDNDIGVVGIAPESTLCIYKVLNNTGGGNYSDVIAALQEAVDEGVHITNNSYGSSGDPGLTVKAAFDNTYAAGVLNIGAAGNSGNVLGIGENCIYPARWQSVIAVAATTQSDSRSSFSSTCPEVELAAPGDQINSTIPSGSYGLKSGTSMASPHVAGTAALIQVAHPTWTNVDIREQLQNTSIDIGESGRDTLLGFGLISAINAVGNVNNPPTAYEQQVETKLDTPVDITLEGSDPDGDSLTFEVTTFPKNGTLAGVTPYLTYTPNLVLSGTDEF